MEHNELSWGYNILFFQLKACGCGLFNDRLALLKETLEVMPLHTAPVPDYLRTPLGEWFLSTLTDADLIEHGSSLGGSWITPKGERLLKCLADIDVFEEHIDNNGCCECEKCEKEFFKK